MIKSCGAEDISLLKNADPGTKMKLQTRYISPDCSGKTGP
ncbi:hypothetical protein BH11BAC1_BH11BAC1_15670 [soil metagenome]